MSKVTAEVKCRHCKRRKAAKDKRGLCFACYITPGIRRQHAPAFKQPKEMTMEELDAMIAQRMKRLPKWWWKEEERMLLDREHPCSRGRRRGMTVGWR